MLFGQLLAILGVRVKLRKVLGWEIRLVIWSVIDSIGIFETYLKEQFDSGAFRFHRAIGDYDEDVLEDVRAELHQRLEKATVELERFSVEEHVH